MCGIIGTVGENITSDILLNGLEKLEYRGYDSAGIYIQNKKEVTFEKVTGRIRDLRNLCPSTIYGQIGIGHTRWATHGGPSVKNAHPHMSNNKRFVLVHNGVITNSDYLKDKYLDNCHFNSETDSEVIVQLLEHLTKDNITTKEAINQLINLLEGSYALAIIDTLDPTVLYGAKNKSPLLIGHGKNANFLASDAMALLSETNTFSEIMDKELIILTKNSIVIENNQGQVVNRTPYKTNIDASASEKGNYEHFMLKEIEEQPTIIEKIVNKYSDNLNQLTIPSHMIEAFLKCDRLYIIACGTSYHAGLMGKVWIEKYTDIPVEVHIASEFSYYTPKLSKNPLFLFISQSGETADSRQALKKLNKLGYKSIVMTNVDNSTLVRETSGSLLLHAGPEISVASTKAYTAQLTVLAILAKVIGEINNPIAKKWDLRNDLLNIANFLRECINNKDNFSSIARNNLTSAKSVFFLGRGKDYLVALEAALKLKEISYIQAEGYAAGELKHGPIALIEKDTPVILFNSEFKTKDHLYSNGEEVRSRGANTIFITTENCNNGKADIVLPNVNEDLTPFSLIIVAQYLAYYTALDKGLDVDKPRNLAKSVTVE